MATQKRQSILFVYTNFASFVQTDFNILASVHNVDKYQFKSEKGALNFISNFLKQFIFLLINIRKYDAIYIWFADYHSFLPVHFARVFGKRSYVVIGGYDVFRIKKINYGVFCSKIRGFFAISSMKHCTANLTVSKYVDRKVKYIASDAARFLIYNCMNLNTKDESIVTKENFILTVTVVDDERTFIRKGLDTFIDTARLLPEYKFAIVGLLKSSVAHLINDCPDNVAIYEKLPHPEMVAFFQKAKVYCQLSRAEAFGVAIAEAMHFGCFPIVTNEGAMPEVVGNHGKVVKRDVGQIVFSIDQYINNPSEKEVLLMEDHLKRLFSPEIRKEKLMTLLDKS